MIRARHLIPLVVVAWLLAWAAPAEASAGCTLHGGALSGVSHSRVIRVSGQVVIYRTRGPAADSIWACRRRHRGSVLVGRDDSYQSAGSEYGPTSTLGGFQVAGDWLLAVQETGADEVLACTKYAAQPCPGPTESVVVVNVSARARGQATSILTHELYASGKPSELEFHRALISAAGVLAWLQTGPSQPPIAPQQSTQLLFGCAEIIALRSVECHAHLLAQGEISADSLRLSAHSLSWSIRGISHTATIE
jgi:hypothetical protein